MPIGWKKPTNGKIYEIFFLGTIFRFYSTIIQDDPDTLKIDPDTLNSTII